MPAVHPLAASPHAGAIAGYRTFVAIVAVNYFALIALTPRAWGAKPSFWPLAILSVLSPIINQQSVIRQSPIANP